MSRKSANSASRTIEPIDRPFDSKIIEKAEHLARLYGMTLRYDPETRRYLGEGLELPLVMGLGRTPDECVTTTRELMVTALAVMLEKGQTPPRPARDNARTEQINIRLSVAEKLRLERQSRSLGFRGVADFVRATVLMK